MLTIIYYVKSESGISPIREDLEKIRQASVKVKIKAVMAHVAENNGQTSYAVAKNIRGFHFSEVRIKCSHNLYRVLYFVWNGNIMVLLHIFVKQEGEETPAKELREAEKRYFDFMDHKNLYQ